MTSGLANLLGRKSLVLYIVALRTSMVGTPLSSYITVFIISVAETHLTAKFCGGNTPYCEVLGWEKHQLHGFEGYNKILVR
jgi:hypothetical protein